MDSFDLIWQILNPQAKYANRKRACYDLWNTFHKDQQEHIIAVIKDKLTKGKFVDYNPYFAILKNSMSHRQTLSFADYYARFGTTEPLDGWHMENPTGQQVIYVKN